MNEDVFNIEVRKFLKTVGVTSQREIETAVRAALAAKKLAGTETLQAKIRLTVDQLGLTHEIAGSIKLG
jgi:ribosomal protein L1